MIFLVFHIYYFRLRTIFAKMKALFLQLFMQQTKLKINGLLLISSIFFSQLAFSVEPVYSFPIPDKVEFAGRTIPLDRYDMRERFDREQIVIAYNHSNSLLQLKRANRYFPIIEPILKKNGIPDDFKYLAVVESNLDTRAVSGVQAAGLWQFMPKTAQQFGLEVNDEIDERYNIEKSTEAVCSYLKNAYDKYKDWTTVAASYNAGMGRVSGELDKQQVTDFFDMLLSSETTRYVFRILAMKRFFQNPKAFGYKLDRDDFYQTINTQNVVVNGPVDDWTVWAMQYGISYSQLKDFNVWLRDRKLTNKNNKEYIIQIPLKSDLYFNKSKIIIHNPMWVDY